MSASLEVNATWRERFREACALWASELTELATVDMAEQPLLIRLESAKLPADARLRILAQTLDVPYLENLAGRQAAAAFVERYPIALAREQQVLALASESGVIQVVLGSHSAWRQLDVIGRLLGRAVEPAFARGEDIHAAINQAYSARTGQAQAVIAALDEREVLAEVEQLALHEDLLDTSGRAPVIRLVNMLLFEAVKCRASDVHIQPYEERVVVRQRIDGVLFDSYQLRKDLQEEITSRIKVLGRMNIAEKRLPQDGRATVEVGDRLVDLRIASLPTSFGERIVIRLLDKSARVYRLADLGMDQRTLLRFQQLIKLEHGLILVTGPTGAGKSTTLYAALQEINAQDRNIVTLEDPIEYQLPGVSQTQVSDKKGMTFASGLRSVLRQDPDIIMVGEIRDHETAVMAIQSALTGHLVFSTLHTNDAASAVTRLLDLGIEQYLVASSLVAVLAQRLVRQVCDKCAEPIALDLESLQRLGNFGEEVDASHIGACRGAGCEPCRGTGYHGRVGVFELLVVDDQVRRKIQERSSAAEIRDAAVRGGMWLLRDDGVAKVQRGVTTVEEVLRVSMRSDL